MVALQMTLFTAPSDSEGGALLASLHSPRHWISIYGGIVMLLLFTVDKDEAKVLSAALSEAREVCL